MSDTTSWNLVNQNLVAKAIGELTFEQILNPKKISDSTFELSLKSGAVYTFDGWTTVWEYLRIVPSSLKRNNLTVTDASQFFLDTQPETGMDDIILGNFFEEMHNTLYSDMILLNKNASLNVEDIINWSGEKIQTVLNGHPKILLNKGRVGWNAEDISKYSPESDASFQLEWLALHCDLISGKTPDQALLEGNLGSETIKIFNYKLSSKGLDPQNFTFIPVHPWQYERFIEIQFAGLIADMKIIYLGVAGDHYRPQISIRTLSNTTNKKLDDIKLPLSILNTSCVRGLPAKTIELGSEISEILGKICKEDAFLKDSQTDVLREKAGIALVHPSYSKIHNAPYRYHEYLGAVWRESSESKLQESERAIIAASLFFQDEDNKSLIGAYVKESGLSIEEWLRAYFKVVVLPLYHLQLTYGVGMVAHGQNIILKMTNFVPTGMILKDFQGDLRLLEELPPQGNRYFSHIKDDLTKLPAKYLIHDLITGHFITVLRFISAVLKESDNFSENRFYSLLAETIQEYYQGKVIPQEQDLLSETYSRVLLNKVRFTIGYGDSSERPLPQLGADLKNPITTKDSLYE